MSVGGIRAILGALLLIVGLVPVTAGQETCAGAGPAELCVADPLVHDAGEARIVDGDVTAHANGGLVSGVGSATFLVDYVIEDETIGPDDTVSSSVRLFVHDNDGELVAREWVSESLSGPGSVEGELEATVGTVTPELEGGTVTVEAKATLSSDGNVTRLGDAVSMAPITVLVTPPSDLAEKTNVGETQVGTFDVGPTQDDGSLADGELFVADGTSVRLEATGELSTRSVDGVDFYDQRARASLSASLGEADYSVSVTPVDEYCSSACSTVGETIEVELSLVIPVDEEPVSDLELGLHADWLLRTPHPSGWGYQTESSYVNEIGHNELVGVGP